MATETIYVVQTFKVGARGALKAETPTSAQSEAGAIRTAERLAGSKAGVVAFASTGDAETGEFEDAPRILFRAGRLPVPFSDGD